nr:RNA-directed DNA polymerase, eukaryota, reverse transcriptase zinc-binding domain protein [Tanacetum cinerariifolium]
KRFGFVRFINVFDVERLVNNLCTIWIGRYKIHANIARFQRAPMNNSSSQFKNNEAKRNYTYTDAKGHANSYLHAVKGFQKLNLGNESDPVLVLDDSCLNQQDYSYCLLGKVKEFSSLSNLKTVLVCDGFENVKIRYLGGFWVMFEFTTEEVKKKFQSCTTISSWFSQIQQATCDFTTDGRVSWAEIEGKSYWIRAKEVPGWVPDFVEDTDDGDESDDDDEGEPKGVMLGDSDVEAVPDTMFEEVLPNANGGDAPSVGNKEMHSKDPFNIYDLLKVKKVPSADSLKYPSGFTPNDDIEDGEVQSAKKKDSTQEKDEGIQNIPEDDVSSEKAGKRFGFVRFINVFDVERLVNNLCTIRIGRYKIHANITRFQRAPMNNSSSQFKNNEAKRNYTYTDAKGHANSYLHAVKGFHKPNLGNKSNHVLVLDGSCLNQQDYSYCLLGKVKEFSSLSNLKTVLVCEVFKNVKIRYLGGFWVMFEFTTKEVKKKFQSCTTISSWFSQIQQATCDFTTDGRVLWVEIEEPKGVMLGDSDVEAVHDTMFEEVLPNANGGDAPSVGNKEMHSEDPFNIYDLLKVKKVPFEDSLKYPSGFTPNDDIEDEEVQSAKRKDSTQEKDEGIQNIPEDDVSSEVMEYDLKMHDKENGLAQKAKKDWVKELCMKNKVKFVSLQETKMEKIKLFNIKRCWGNFAFEYVHSDSVGNSGGILCVWDTNLFFKHNATVSDYFVAVQGIWVPNGKQMLIISMYAPQELTEKKMLWDYLSLVITNWKGEVIIMGDFNEVRNKTERFGSVFNAQGANAFNTFISSSGLAEVPLGGCSFTWCHKSATKMSKLDSSKSHLISSKVELAHLDALIDNGEGTEAIVQKRTTLVDSILKDEKLHSMEVAQKAKINWAIEGDENSKFYHVILIFSYSSDESMGFSTSRTILFGTILAEIPAEISIILPREPEAGVTIVASPTGVLDLITHSVAARPSPPPSPHVPRRPAILVLPGQSIPLGRPYHTQPNEVRKMLTARKSV